MSKIMILIILITYTKVFVNYLYKIKERIIIKANNLCVNRKRGVSSVTRSIVTKNGTGREKNGILASKSGHKNKAISMKTKPVYNGNLS